MKAYRDELKRKIDQIPEEDILKVSEFIGYLITKRERIEPVLETKGIDRLDEMKIGEIVRKVLRKMLEDGKVTEQEVVKMQSKKYSKETFGIQYPLLYLTNSSQGKSPIRYYSASLMIYGKEYFLCSEWYEVPANNDRPYLMKWLGLHI